jgi:hypothetical protein
VWREPQVAGTQGDVDPRVGELPVDRVVASRVGAADDDDRGTLSRSGGAEGGRSMNRIRRQEVDDVFPGLLRALFGT